jgi:hypothetical protein
MDVFSPTIPRFNLGVPGGMFAFRPPRSTCLRPVIFHPANVIQLKKPVLGETAVWPRERNNVAWPEWQQINTAGSKR